MTKEFSNDGKKSKNTEEGQEQISRNFCSISFAEETRLGSFIEDKSQVAIRAIATVTAMNFHGELLFFVFLEIIMKKVRRKSISNSLLLQRDTLDSKNNQLPIAVRLPLHCFIR